MDPIREIADSLSAAWLFLSGEQRKFELAAGRIAPAYRPFSCVLDMAIPTLAMRFKVCVLLDLRDAVQVTRHMFGFTGDDVDKRDVLDASAEVCNVLSDAITSSLSGFETAGVPSMMDAATYQQFCDSDYVYEVYVGTCAENAVPSIINVVVLLPKIGL